MNTLIIDDDPVAVAALRERLATYPELTVVGEASTASEGLRLAEELKPEAVFLDVELSDLSGLEITDALREKLSPSCRIVIYTAYNEYILSAFRRHAFDCLMKPIDNVDLDSVIRRLLSPAGENIAERPGTSGKLLFYTNTEDFRLVAIRDICVFRYDGELRLWAVEAAGCPKPIYLRRNVTKENILALDPRFVSVSKRHIINLNYLMEVIDNVCIFYPPFDTIDYVKVGRLYRRALINRYNTI